MVRISLKTALMMAFCKKSLGLRRISWVLKAG